MDAAFSVWDLIGFRLFKRKNFIKVQRVKKTHILLKTGGVPQGCVLVTFLCFINNLSHVSAIIAKFKAKITVKIGNWNKKRSKRKEEKKRGRFNI